ncbi:MAG: DUF2199 domain-containing protein [Gammaproteobacteria bacterium]|nr:DUF2199 domain-containing protein [Gammaproteobacteria bacterium]
MAALFAFKCSQCGEVHEGSPSFSYPEPAPFAEQNDEVRKEGLLNSDLCRYIDEEGPHFFIRVCLEIPIQGVEEPFLWGVWVSLSEESYLKYVEDYESPNPDGSFFGWFCNYLPYYASTYALPTMVHPQSGGSRPLITLEQSEHELCQDFHRGISPEKAQEIAEIAWHR